MPTPTPTPIPGLPPELWEQLVGGVAPGTPVNPLPFTPNPDQQAPWGSIAPNPTPTPWTPGYWNTQPGSQPLPGGGEDYSPDYNADFGWRSDPQSWQYWRPTGEQFRENPYGTMDQYLYNTFMGWMDPRTQESTVNYLSEVNPEVFGAMYGSQANQSQPIAGGGQTSGGPLGGLNYQTVAGSGAPGLNQSDYADVDRITNLLQHWDQFGGVQGTLGQLTEALGEDPTNPGQQTFDPNTYGQGIQWLYDYLDVAREGMGSSPTQRATRAQQAETAARLQTMRDTASQHPSMAGVVTLGQNLINPVLPRATGNRVTDNRVIDAPPTNFAGQILNPGLT